MTVPHVEDHASLNRLSDPVGVGRPSLSIAHVVTRYLRGGSERRIRDMVHALPEAEHHLVLGADSDVDLAAREIEPASVVVIPTLVRRPDPFRDAVTLRRLLVMLRHGSHDVVVTHQSKAGVLGRIASRRAGIPVIHSLSMASFGPGYPGWQSSVFTAIERRLGRRTDAFAVVGTDLARRYEQIGVPGDKLHVIRSGVRLPSSVEPVRADDVRRTHGIPPGRRVVLYLGSLEARKNVLELPMLLAGLLRSAAGTEPHLVVAGEGPLEAALAARLRSLGIADRATLTGFVQNPVPLVRAAHAVVLLSSAEGVPQVLVQAAAVGTPFVAWEVDGVRELIELGADGAVEPSGDLDGAIAATERILLRERRTRAATIDLTPWHPRTIVDDHRRVFASVVGSLERSPDAVPMERIA